MILDEPTNHLDIDSRAALIEAINDYAGAVVLISHDRHLIDACADRLWLVADGTVSPFDGDLDEYRRQVLSDRRERDPAMARRQMARNETRTSRTERPCRGGAARRTWRRCSRRITRAEAAIDALDAGARHARHRAGATRPLCRSGPRVRPRQGARGCRRGARRAETDWLAASTEYEEAMAVDG